MSKGKTGMKTKYFYSDYVNHMVRFYLTCPDKLEILGKRRSDIENWVAVQGVLRGLSDADRELVLAVYGKHHNLPRAVELYCQDSGADSGAVWPVLVRMANLIAKRRGLV